MIKAAVYTFTSCGGCQVSMLSLGARLFDLLKDMDFKVFVLLQRHEHPIEDVDIAFIDGCISMKKHIQKLKEIRKRARFIVALGACACFGGVPALHKFIDEEKDATLVEFMKRWGTIEVSGIDNFIDVDHYLFGCPINPYEFYELMETFIKERRFPETKEVPVCVECKEKRNRCLLLDKRACLGPIVRGGCGALCPSKNVPCEGCRSFIPNADFGRFIGYLKTIATEEEIRGMLFKYTSPSKIIDITKKVYSNDAD